MAYEVVVIGSSPGGLDAVSTVLAALPEGCPLPIVIAQHRGAAPSADGRLEEIGQRHTTWVVCDAQDKAPIAPGYVYVAPPAISATAVSHVLGLRDLGRMLGTLAGLPVKA